MHSNKAARFVFMPSMKHESRMRPSLVQRGVERSARTYGLTTGLPTESREAPALGPRLEGVFSLCFLRGGPSGKMGLELHPITNVEHFQAVALPHTDHPRAVVNHQLDPPLVEVRVEDVFLHLIIRPVVAGFTHMQRSEWHAVMIQPPERLLAVPLRPARHEVDAVLAGQLAHLLQHVEPRLVEPRRFEELLPLLSPSADEVFAVRAVGERAVYVYDDVSGLLGHTSF